MKRNPPIIATDEYGPVTEWARHRAALNMLANPEVKSRVEGLIGVEKARHNYPEAYPTWLDRAIAWLRGIGAR